MFLGIQLKESTQNYFSLIIRLRRALRRCLTVRNHMGDEAGVDAADHPRVDFSDLVQVVHVRVTRSSAALDDLLPKETN